MKLLRELLRKLSRCGIRCNCPGLFAGSIDEAILLQHIDNGLFGLFSELEDSLFKAAILSHLKASRRTGEDRRIGVRPLLLIGLLSSFLALRYVLSRLPTL